jgi:hypothetical protein
MNPDEQKHSKGKIRVEKTRVMIIYQNMQIV